MNRNWYTLRMKRPVEGELYDITNDTPYIDKVLNIHQSVKCISLEVGKAVFAKGDETYTIDKTNVDNWWISIAKERAEPMVDEGIEKVVKNICYSLQNKPHEWEVSSQFITHLPSKIRFLESEVLYFFGVWDGEDTLRVFNEEQLNKIRDAYKKFRATRRIKKQDKVLGMKRLLVSLFG